MKIEKLDIKIYLYEIIQGRFQFKELEFTEQMENKLIFQKKMLKLLKRKVLICFAIKNRCNLKN
jgi:hypothetical protein